MLNDWTKKNWFDNFDILKMFTSMSLSNDDSRTDGDPITAYHDLICLRLALSDELLLPC